MPPSLFPGSLALKLVFPATPPQRDVRGPELSEFPEARNVLAVASFCLLTPFFLSYILGIGASPMVLSHAQMLFIASYTPPPGTLTLKYKPYVCLIGLFFVLL